MSVAELLGPGGPFARSLPGYEARPGQVEMAAAVDRCLAEDGILLCEAGTGTGKTLAYLVPALVAARQRTIVISTATRALQDQIFHKDLPLAERVLGMSADAVMIKGLSNYLCQRRYQALLDSGASLDARWSRALPLVDAWAARSASGRVDELAELAEDDPIWPLVTASSETRIGVSCPHFDTCFVTRLKREASSARLLIVNHHLFFADLALRGAHPGAVLPPYDAVIFDEAHQLEDVATRYFGLSVSSARVARLVRDARLSFERPGVVGQAAVFGQTTRIEHAAQAFFDALERSLANAFGREPATGERRAPLEPSQWVGGLQAAWFSLDTALEGLAGVLDPNVLGEAAASPNVFGGAAAENREMLEQRARSLRDDLSAIVQGAPGCVAWFEASERNRVLCASPIELGAIFQKRLFEVAPAVVLTSATLTSGVVEDKNGEARAKRRNKGRALATELDDEGYGAPPPEPEELEEPREVSGPFRFVRERLGLYPELYRVEELVVPSPFDFATRALLYVPDDLPLPDAADFSACVAARAAELIELADGGAFVLTTSVRSMLALHRRLQASLGTRPLFLQGQAPKGALIERFRTTKGAVLVATASFWQGVDVPGEALRLVILEKAPFPVPTDPLIQARSKALELAGHTPFMRLHLPLAKLNLKQGFGRLIRTRSDHGVVALLDVRAHKRGYGQRLLEGLPPAPRVTSLAEVRTFFAERAAGV